MINPGGLKLAWVTEEERTPLWVSPSWVVTTQREPTILATAWAVRSPWVFVRRSLGDDKGVKKQTA
jgi:hypothetical protein